MISSVFYQWREIAKTMKLQRLRLKNFFRSMVLPSKADIFHAWKSFVVNKKLKEALISRKDQEEVLDIVQTELASCRETEKQLEAELTVMQKEVVDMQSKMVKTLNAIDSQKVQETMQLIEAVAKSLISTGDLVIAAIRPTLEDIASSPSLRKLAAIFCERDQAIASQQADTQDVLEQKKLTDRLIAKRRKRTLARKRKRNREKKVLPSVLPVRRKKRVRRQSVSFSSASPR